jgi:hypothetical protein
MGISLFADKFVLNLVLQGKLITNYLIMQVIQASNVYLQLYVYCLNGGFEILVSLYRRSRHIGWGYICSSAAYTTGFGNFVYDSFSQFACLWGVTYISELHIAREYNLWGLPWIKHLVYIQLSRNCSQKIPSKLCMQGGSTE